MSKINIDAIKETEEPQPRRKKSTISGDVPGSVSYSIGTGKHAQDSVVWLTIRWSFILGLVLSLVLVVFMWPVAPDGVHPPIEAVFPIEQLKTIWAIFVPIVTLALGYMFGKGK
ncbi:hypothetical protein AB9W56_004264 [Vibrio vulnificus]|uniref:hypothetical protein n=1 Tax=Vibrio vulnificus TaxID=672 RepID=UPI001A1D146A|nr:hypothetical protein [Vibrio vulnificus]ELX4126671.1 hypothetical protein [Vibrio vulnificus]WIL73003.1 hypothetical protein QPX65_08610 [Vibrio vulnificus]HAT8507136.1 hypothetical protein [Vibrio vulnificus]